MYLSSFNPIMYFVVMQQLNLASSPGRSALNNSFEEQGLASSHTKVNLLLDMQVQ